MGERRVKIVEEGGTTLQTLLCKKNPLGERLCDRWDCKVCNFVEAKGKCQAKSVVYTNTCIMCEQDGLDCKYWGETAATLYIRSKQHVGDAEDKLTSSHIHQHLVKAHPEALETGEWKDKFRFEMIEQSTNLHLQGRFLNA